MKRRINLLILFGSLLLLSGLSLLIFSVTAADKAEKDAADILAQLDPILPQSPLGTPGTYSTPEMPVLRVSGRDLIAVIEIPDYHVRLPVESRWKNVLYGLPRRFSGSAYDNSLVIGGSDQSGFFECLKYIENNAPITVKDMTGAEFSYTVERILRSDTAEAELLMNEEAALTLFVRDTHTLEYILVRCFPGTAN